MKTLDEALKLYEKEFNDIFPLFSMQCTPEEEIIKIIDECIANKKDVYDMGYLVSDENICY